MPFDSILSFFNGLNLAPVIQTAKEIFAVWWWVPLPFIIWRPLLFFWLWWRQDIYDDTVKRVIIEVRVPDESLKPIRAMDTVISGMWQIYGPPNWFEKWWKGEFLLGFSFEIVSIDGIPHFYIRLPLKYRTITESHIYSQYPDAEITEVEDYSNKVPLDIPNKEWEMWGTDYHTLKPDPYPIKTYPEFETEKESEEEKRVDPISGLLEGMTRLKPGEQLWVQVVAIPFLDEKDWLKEGEAIKNKLVNRKSNPPVKTMVAEMGDLAVLGMPPGVKQEETKDILPPEMKLTPGEKNVVAAIERKISKLGFVCNVRYLYVAKRDAFNTHHIRIPMSYFANFVTNDLNAIVPWGQTITKIKQNWYDWYLLVQRRLYARKRRIIRNYRLRQAPLFPLPGGDFILDAEELATIYHFPSRTVAPASTVVRVESKKSEAPADLPVE